MAILDRGHSGAILFRVKSKLLLVVDLPVLCKQIPSNFNVTKVLCSTAQSLFNKETRAQLENIVCLGMLRLPPTPPGAA
jgi:hypothetical protein